MQRALLQFSVPHNYNLVKEALIKADRDDLIGSGSKCLIPEVPPRQRKSTSKVGHNKTDNKTTTKTFGKPNNKSKNSSENKHSKKKSSKNDRFRK